MRNFSAVVVAGMYEWDDREINDTVRCLARAFGDFGDVDRYYLDPPRGLRALKGDLSYVLGSFGWHWRESFSNGMDSGPRTGGARTGSQQAGGQQTGSPHTGGQFGGARRTDEPHTGSMPTGGQRPVKVGTMPLGFLPVRLGLRERANRYAARGFMRLLKRRYGSNWRERVLFYVSSGSYTLTGFIRELDPEHMVFHLLDDNFAFPVVGDDRRVWNENKAFMEYMMRQSALVIAVSDELVEKYGRAYKRDIHLVGNGVDVAHFSLPGRNLAGVPEMENIPRPVLMFVGAVNSWIDIGLLHELAEKRRDCSLVLVGPCFESSVDRGRWAALCEKDNVYWLGSRPYSELPRYMQYASVLLLPRTMDEHSRCSDPLKLYEYMATGKPVAAVGIPAVEKFSNFIFTAGGREGFVAAVNRALEERAGESQERREKQLAMAGSCSWSSRVRQICNLLL